MTWKDRHIFLIKCVCVIVSVLFVHEQIGWTQDGKPVWNYARPYEQPVRDKMNHQSFDLPYDVASTQTVEVNGGENTIIHVQDAHSSLAAQESIASLLDSLMTNYDMEFVAIEGAVGYVDTSILRSYPDKDVRKETAKYLMREGRMGAGEFFEITCGNENVTLYGIEDEKLYRANIDSFREIALERTGDIDGINKAIEQLKSVSDKVYSDDLKKIAGNAELHRDGKLNFVDHWKTLEPIIRKHEIDTAKYPALMKLLEAIDIEKNIDFKKANNERRTLIDELGKVLNKKQMEELVLKSVAYKNNKVSQTMFHKYLVELAEENGMPADKYENLIKFARYVTIYEAVDIIQLYAEMSAVESDAREKVYRNDDERKVFEMIYMLRLLKQLYAMETNNGEYLYFKAHNSELSAEKYVSFIKYVCGKYSVPVTGGYDMNVIFGGIPGAMKFYEIAAARNNAMINNTLNRMNKEGKHVAALITGGYHSEGLIDLMKAKKLSYLVVAPKYDTAKERPYVAVLTNKARPYEKILEEGKYQLAVPAFFYESEGNIERMAPAINLTLAQEVLRNQAYREKAEEWAEVYRDIVYPTLKSRGSENPVSPQDFQKYLGMVNIVKIDGVAICGKTNEKGELEYTAYYKDSKGNVVPRGDKVTPVEIATYNNRMGGSSITVERRAEAQKPSVPPA
ncbi:MAG TPA: hypothetical protein PKG81_05475, partial [Candidatus Omnitrophota bacterium]|nr:hypothetical protein [Candidatus Omnitrophota bacterium]